MSGAKRGRKSKYGSPEAAKQIKVKVNTLSALMRDRQAEYDLMDLAPEQKEAAKALAQAHEALIHSVALKDLIDKHADIDLLGLVARHPPIAHALWLRFNSLDDLASLGYDASIRAMIERVIHDQHLKDLRDDTTKIEKRVAVTKAIAKKLIADNEGKQPRNFYKLIAKDLEQDFGDVSKSTINRDLKTPDDQSI